jgi:hypothetical protein
LRARVGARRVVGGVLGEALRVVELQVAVDLVGADVVEPLLVLAHGLEDRVGADDVGLDERARVVERVVVVRLRGVVDDRVGLADQVVHQRCVGDVADDQLHAVLREAGQRLPGRGVRQLVEDRDLVVSGPHEVVDEVGADEPGSTGHKEAFHGCDLRSNRGRAPARPRPDPLGCKA